MRILIVDDEINMIKTLGAVLRRDGYDISGVTSAEDALKILETETTDLIISDVRMPGLTGMELLGRIREKKNEIPLILMTAFGTIEDAVDAMKSGASDYITKPFSMDEIKIKITRLLELARLKQSEIRLTGENQVLKQVINEEVTARFDAGDLVSEDPNMAHIWNTVRKVADQKSTVLISGESGTGKEVVARKIHSMGSRCHGPFIPVHCAALSPALLESELFGHEKGAFTGAIRKKTGRFELANGGTIFLDEVGEIPMEIQVKLLRVLQELQFERVGGEESIHVDTRIIAATNRDLMELIKTSRFREDLYYRLNVIHLEIPPLRDRPQDILPLANHFLNRLSLETGKQFQGFSEDGTQALITYTWPGNVRELENAIERAVVLDSGPIITDTYLPQPAGDTRLKMPESDAPGALAETEKDTIIRVLAVCSGNKALAAEKLGIGRTTLWRKMKTYGLLE